MARLGWLLLLLAAGVRADTDAARPRSEGELVFRLFPGFEVQVNLTSNRIIGPSISLSRKGDSFSGTIGRGAASLKLTDSGLTGFGREGSIALHAERDGDQVVVRGSYGTRESEESLFAVRPRTGRVEITLRRIRVQNGKCEIEVERKGSVGPFRGGGFCGTSYRQAELYMDDSLMVLLSVEPEIVGLMVLESTVASN